ncbi:diacylglycerol kinase [Mycoavidus sp. B2-EB]|uniref:diacylglycerol kinase n=1 Tax=Mycoavidus sp. B2-EB TaxID=2651972 RepID=UPI001E549FE1|nr:diacylglycerol kinase [Mycoavidus sp. B2-EB]BBO59748.1 diacylglycerol kinase [Mycoavidus sp. B2-EB]
MNNFDQKPRGLACLWHALRYSLCGMRDALMQERAFRQEMMLALILIPLAVVLPVTMVERLMLIASILWVLSLELLNSAVEAAIDRISLEPHPLAKQAKDFASAAVFIALCLCGLIWLTLAGPLVWAWLRAGLV